MNTEERTITIVDDIMGSGKSTWAINYINDNPDRKFLCIVPLLSECERFKDGTDIDIVDPEKWGSKWKHFRWLVENEKNIVTTHSLIQKMDLDMLELLGAHAEGLALCELAQALRLPRSTAFNLAQTLTRLGYATQREDTGKYRLGLKMFEIGAGAMHQVDVMELIRGCMVSLIL